MEEGRVIVHIFTNLIGERFGILIYGIELIVGIRIHYGHKTTEDIWVVEIELGNYASYFPRIVIVIVMTGS